MGELTYYIAQSVEGTISEICRKVVEQESNWLTKLKNMHTQFRFAQKRKSSTYRSIQLSHWSPH